ncbi:zinc finger protein 761-like [Culicoides brevitarsis]|uniref:zinc finger protein 761-like n=1 Tax=Culicoides brevitarsis TaxID=469753 RepID=UPI00307B781E
MEIEQQKVNIVIKFGHSEVPSFEISSKNDKSMENMKVLSAFGDAANEIHCRKCSQTLQINIFWAEKSEIEVKQAENSPKNKNFGLEVSQIEKISENYSCDICQKSCKDQKSLKSHRKLHFFQLLNDETCVGCEKTFKTPEKRLLHTSNCPKKDKINPNSCAHCPHIARNFTRLRFHISSKHGPCKKTQKPSVLCHLCSQTVLKEHLENHLRRHETSDGKAYECDHCAKRFSSVSGIKEHLTRLHFPHLANFKCQLCDFGTRTEHIFKLHLSRKHEIGEKSAETNFVCPICRQILKTRGSLRQHIVNFHTNPQEKRIYNCETCNKSFFSKYNLEKHEFIHKPDEEKPFRCRECGKGFGDKHKFQQHLACHDTKTSNLYCCPTCGKGMKYKQSLETHMRIHTGDTPYECQVCGKKFADRGNYRQHLKQHEKAMNVKLTFTAEERRLMKLKLLDPEQISFVQKN